MKYAHILMAFASEIWAMEPLKLAAMIEFLAIQASGEKFDAAEIEARIAPQTANAVARRDGAIAILPMRGVISNRAPMVTNSSTGGGVSAEGFGNAFDAQVADDQVKAIIIDADTPGGNVLGIEELRSKIFAARGSKPIIAQVNANLASAGYWALSGADEIVVTPSGAVGAIGVRTAHDDISAALAKEGIERTIIAAGKYKGEGLLGPLSEEALAHVQGQVDSYYGMFVDGVAQGRGVASSVVREGFGQGRMVTAKAAVAEGMADRIGTMADTLARFGVAPKKPGGRSALAPEREKRAIALI